MRHEQLHFDLAELTSEKIRRRLSELDGVCAKADRDADVEKIIVQMTAEFGKEQAVYDDETAHGTKAPIQQQWRSRVERAFRER